MPQKFLLTVPAPCPPLPRVQPQPVVHITSPWILTPKYSQIMNADIFTYGAACEAIRSITRQSVDVVDVVDVVPSEFINSVHRA